MKKENIILWISAAVISFLVIYASNLFSSDYPISGTFGINGKKVSYRFEKTHYGQDSLNIVIRSDVKEIKGKVFWKYDNDSNWFSKEMLNSDLALSTKIQSIKPNHNIKYYVVLSYHDKEYFLPDNQKVELKFFGKIPSLVGSLRFLLFNLGFLLIVRVGLEYFNKNEKIKKFEIFVAIIFLILTALVNPLYLSYKFGYINTSIPSITQLFPIKELAITSLWIITIVLTFNSKKYRIYPLVSAIISIILLLIFN